MSDQQRLFPLPNSDPFIKEEGEYGEVPGGRKLRWVENSFHSYKSPLEQPHDYLGISLGKRLQVILFLVVFLVGGILLFRVSWLQIAKGGHYSGVAESNRTRHIPIASERGIIYDRKGRPLVTNIPKYALHVIPNDIPRDKSSFESLVHKVAGIMSLPEVEVKEVFDQASSSKDRELLIYDNIDQTQAIALSVSASELPAIQVVTGITRSYFFSDEKKIESLSHIIGYEGKISPEEYEEKKYSPYDYSKNDYIGKQGIERQYESVLRGEKGDRVIEVNSSGIGLSNLSERAPRQGQNLTLTIDLELQRVAEQALMRVLRVNNKSKGVVVVEGTQTGELLALVSLPGFDNSAFTRGLTSDEYESVLKDDRKPLINRAVNGQYPSGSVIKPLVALAALEEFIITPKTTLVSTGGISVGPWFFPDWKSGGHGRVNVKGAIAESVNTFFYIIGGGYQDRDGLGVNRIARWLSDFGLSYETGVDIPSELSGFIPTPKWKQETKGERWYIGDTYNMSIGQGDVLVTPLQMSRAISAIANGGTLNTPRVVKFISEESTEFPDSIVIEAQPKNYDTVRWGMREAVLEGSAKRLRSIPLTIAGKTGTAQWSSIHDPHAWFVGFAPFNNPQITVTVLVEEGGEGSRVAVPVAQEIFKWWQKHPVDL